MRGRFVVWTLVVAVVGWCSDPGQARPVQPSPVCGPANARTVAADAVARVYSAAQSVYGCSAKTGLRTTLGVASGSAIASPIGVVALAGSDVAYAQMFVGYDAIVANVIVQQLTDGQQLSQFQAITAFIGAEPDQEVRSIVVKSDGAVAWIASESFFPRFAIQVFRGHGRRMSLLDHARGRKVIVATSLRLHRSHLSWTHGGKLRHAVLR